MKTDRLFSITKSLVWIMLLPFLWMGFTSGLFALLTDQITEGIIWIAILVVVLVVLLQGSLLSRFEGMNLPFGPVLILGGVTVLIGIDEIINIVYSKVTITGKIHIPSLVSLVSSIGFVVIAVIVVLKLVNLVRTSEE
jgi:hypothetical protein